MANYVFNSSLSGETYNAKCLNVSDDSEWTPSVAEYPQDGTIDLSGGTSGRYLDTQWTAPQNTEWTMSGIYNVVMGVSYDMYSIHYKGNQTCDIYLGSNTEDLVLSESDKDYTPPTGNWIIEEEPPAIIINDPLGSETITGVEWTIFQEDTEDKTWSSSSGSQLSLNITTGGSSSTKPAFQVLADDVLTAGASVRFSFDATFTAGTGDPFIYRVYKGAFHELLHTMTQGHNTFDILATDLYNGAVTVFVMYIDGRDTFDLEMTNISVKEIL